MTNGLRGLTGSLLVKSVALGALLVGGLVAAESAGVPTPGPSVIQFANAGNEKSDKDKADKDKADKDKADKDKHCKDGKGKDDEKNKHCRPPSGKK